MKKLCQLIVLSTVAGCYSGFAQEVPAAPQPLGISAHGPLVAMHVVKPLVARAVVPPADIAVTGKVLDERGTGLPGVSVVVKGTTQGATTDGEGSFRITVPNANSILVFSFVGYLRKEVTVGAQTSLNVTLAPDDQTLNEVVVVGYGSQLKKEITGAVQTVSAQEIKDLPVSQIGQKLQGRLAGVQINQATGKPGQGISIRIRGQVSVTAGSDPLYVVDGFPITGNIAQLNPDEIEDISILKDAASTSLYGSRAANGVVLITTKKGKPGQTNISFSAFAGVQQVPMRGRVKMLDAVQFAQFKKEYYEDQLQPVPVEFQNPSQYEGKNNDWYDAVLREAPIQSYNLSISNNPQVQYVAGSRYLQSGWGRAEQ